MPNLWDSQLGQGMPRQRLGRRSSGAGGLRSDLPRRAVTTGALLVAVTLSGCSGAGRVQLAAADAMDAAAASFAVALEEYDRDLRSADVRRDRYTTFALIERIRTNGSDEIVVGQHAETFLAALSKIQADRRVAQRRYWMTKSNLETLRLLADDLRRFALSSDALSLQAQSVIADALALMHRLRSTPGDSNGKTK